MAYRVLDQQQVSPYTTELVRTNIQSVMTNHDLHTVPQQRKGLLCSIVRKVADQKTILSGKTQKKYFTVQQNRRKCHAVHYHKKPIFTNMTIAIDIYTYTHRGRLHWAHLCAQNDMMPCVSLMYSADIT